MTNKNKNPNIYQDLGAREASFPLDKYTAHELKEALQRGGLFDFTPAPGGLFSASTDLSGEALKSSNMDMSWFRDSTHIATALYQYGDEKQKEVAVNAANTMLAVFKQNSDLINNVVDGITNENGEYTRLPVRVDSVTLQNDTEPRVQNDSVGYPLELICKLITSGDIDPSSEDLETIAQTVRYLAKIEYWKDPDDGHWEEDTKIHSSSIGIAVASLMAAQNMFKNSKFAPFAKGIDFEALIGIGKKTLDTMLELGITQSDPHTEDADTTYLDGVKDNSFTEYLKSSFYKIWNDRPQDASMLFSVERGVYSPEQSKKIVKEIIETLVRDRGTIRYIGDTYWEPLFTYLFSADQRTTQGENRTEDRNTKNVGVALAEKEAQWTLFDSKVASIHFNLFLNEGDIDYYNKGVKFLSRALNQIVPSADGSLAIPEAFYFGPLSDDTDSPEPTKVSTKTDLIPNDHRNLAWSRANLFEAVSLYEKASEALSASRNINTAELATVPNL